MRGRRRPPARRSPTQTLPRRTREYLSYIFDSRNWDRFQPRPGDIVISTSYKSGTTWMQNIVLRLVFHGRPGRRSPRSPPGSTAATPPSPRPSPGSRRSATAAIIKSHLPLDALPYVPRGALHRRRPRPARRLHVVLEPLFRVHRRLPRRALRPRRHRRRCRAAPTISTPSGRSGSRAAGSPGRARAGRTPATSTTPRRWWTFRQLDNILFVHFADLLAALPEEIARVAALPRHRPLPAGDRRRAPRRSPSPRSSAHGRRRPRCAEEAARSRMEERPRHLLPQGHQRALADVLTPDELRMYERAKARCLPADCAAFLETGRFDAATRAAE